jgi:hypothetical protein
MTLLEKILDSLSNETKAIVAMVDLSKSAEEIVLTLENEKTICFNVFEKHDQEIRQN